MQTRALGSMSTSTDLATALPDELSRKKSSMTCCEKAGAPEAASPSRVVKRDDLQKYCLSAKNWNIMCAQCPVA